MLIAEGRSDLDCMELSISIPCGSGEHPVTIALTVWGESHIVFNPCHILPPGARQFALSSCEQQVQQQIRFAKQLLQYAWCESELGTGGIERQFPPEHHRKLAQFLDSVRDRQWALAKTACERSSTGGASNPNPAGNGGHDQGPANRAKQQQATRPQTTDGLPEDLRSDLLAGIDSSDPETRWSAILCAGRLGDPDLTDAMFAAWDHWPFWAQLAALGTWNEVSDPVCIPLLRSWILDDRVIPSLRSAFAHTLGEMGDLRDVDALVDALDSPSPDVALHASHALNRLLQRLRQQRPDGPQDIQTALSSLLGEQNPRRRQTGISWLGQSGIGQAFALEIIAALESPWPRTRAGAADVLGDLICTQAIEPLTDQLQQEHDASVASSLATAIVAILPGLRDKGHAFTDLLLRAIQIPHYRVVTASAHLMGEIGDGKFASALIQLLEGSPVTTTTARATAAAALGKIGAPQAIGPLIAAQSEHKTELNRAIVPALQSIVELLPRDASALPVLSQTLGVPYLVLPTVLKLKQINAPETVSLLVQVLGKDTVSQAIAIDALEKTGTPRALAAILSYLNTCAPDMRERATMAAKKLIRSTCGHTPSDLSVLDQAIRSRQLDVAVEAARALRLLAHPKSTDSLVHACLRGNPDLSREATHALLRIKGPQIAAELGQHLSRGDNLTARGAWESLVTIGSPAIPVLTKALKWRYNRARQLAASALGRIGDPSAVGALKSAANDRDPKVREAARAALRQIRTP